MKKLFCMVALAAISFGSVYAHSAVTTNRHVMQNDTTKKKKTKRDSTKRKKDSTDVKQQIKRK
ncbi:hypothetical protein [Mucilaginibacter gotjawali]|uniref:Enterochelin esterase-like enzyme n=2 Tax=Mucilaginibacter gotjawali TaxID=1550579 RepID=A0A839SNH9_9SPHI|nr:hypothetical protein [Mucilaginibacter gotjawali]MBB3058049.1 enterochelin esterase-like enzyme [Mucilaginibacter gotjawali]BAU52024.1 hypothetical protein MgSA37_00174 [Mucilaginibacter gotjawali]